MRAVPRRDVFDAILWITRTGAQCGSPSGRNLDSQFPQWSAVYYYRPATRFDQWSKDGTLERINLALNILERIQVGREATPSLGLVDSQSVKLAPRMIEHRGTDGNKWVNGRKRQVMVDVLGRIWKTQVHAANIHDSPGGIALLDNRKQIMPALQKIITDKSYRGTFCQAVEEQQLIFEVPVREEEQKGFVAAAARWKLKDGLLKERLPGSISSAEL